MKRIAIIPLILSAILYISAPAYAENTFIPGIPVSGDGFEWDGEKLVLNNYEGPDIRIEGDADIILNGTNKITTEYGHIGIYGKDITIDGKGSGKLDIMADEGYGIFADNVEFKDVHINISSNCEEDGAGICIFSKYEGQNTPEYSLAFNNVTGIVSAPGGSAVYGFPHKLILENTDTDKEIGVCTEYSFPGYSFVSTEKTIYETEDEFENHLAERVTLTGKAQPRIKNEDMIVKGEVLDLSSLHNTYPTGQCVLDDKKMRKFATIKKQWLVKGKRPGAAIVNIVDENNEVLLKRSITVLKRPKLKLPKVFYQESTEPIDAYLYFTTKDTLMTAADAWESSNENVATVDEKGCITVKNKGKTRIIAHFGNIKVKSLLKVTETKLS